MKTTAEKRELVKRLRGLADAVCNDIIRDAADFIESTLPKQKSPAERLKESVTRHGLYLGSNCSIAVHEQRVEAIAAELGVEPQELSRGFAE